MPLKTTTEVFGITHVYSINNVLNDVIAVPLTLEEISKIGLYSHRLRPVIDFRDMVCRHPKQDTR